jgi:arsenate reductase-like glutaredoxin family protein
MKIAFDVHGVIADRPDLFKPLLKMFKTNNIGVIIISGPTKQKITDELAKVDPAVQELIDTQNTLNIMLNDTATSNQKLMNNKVSRYIELINDITE